MKRFISQSTKHKGLFGTVTPKKVFYKKLPTQHSHGSDIFPQEPVSKTTMGPIIQHTAFNSNKKTLVHQNKKPLLSSTVGARALTDIEKAKKYLELAKHFFQLAKETSQQYKDKSSKFINKGHELKKTRDSLGFYLFIAMIALGYAKKYYLNTEEGNKLILEHQELVNQLEELTDSLVEKLNSLERHTSATENAILGKLAIANRRNKRLESAQKRVEETKAKLDAAKKNNQGFIFNIRLGSNQAHIDNLEKEYQAALDALKNCQLAHEENYYKTLTFEANAAAQLELDIKTIDKILADTSEIIATKQDFQDRYYDYYETKGYGPARNGLIGKALLASDIPVDLVKEPLSEVFNIKFNSKVFELLDCATATKYPEELGQYWEAVRETAAKAIEQKEKLDGHLISNQYHVLKSASSNARNLEQGMNNDETITNNKPRI